MRALTPMLNECGNGGRTLTQEEQLASSSKVFARVHLFKRGFSLIELLVVVALLSLLIAMTMPVFQIAKSKTRSMRCLNNLRQIGGALHMYATENNNLYPQQYNGHSDSGSWHARTDVYLDVRSTRIKNQNTSFNMYATRYIQDSKVWWCPDAKLIPAGMSSGRMSYNMHYGMSPYCLGNGRQTEGPWARRLHAPPNPSRTILIAEYNRNGSAFSPISPVERTGKVNSDHRISHAGGKAANYLFADGHAEYILGDQGEGGRFANSYTARNRMWRWW
jgi:prepilin-type N-terminal cleavage/methylation domain-containing protein/prepilin-type processing-associated H-X9-DG protein